MKTNNVLKIFALMLVLALMLSSCGNAGGKSYDPDEPVTAEPLMENFIEFTETTTPIYDIVSMLDEYGKLQSTNEDYTVFCNETKDHLNNLTKTFAVYENETGKTVLTLKNTYADEYRGTDKHGNPYRAPNELNVKVYTTNGVSVIVATYSTYTPIDDEIIKEEELKESYYKTVRTEFYDMQGNLLAKSNDTIDPKVEGSTSRFTALSLGRTVVLLDRYDNTVVRTFDGDTEVVSVPDAIVGEFYYYFGQSDSSGSYSNKANKLEVCDENGKVVCTYTFSLNPTTMPKRFCS